MTIITSFARLLRVNVEGDLCRCASPGNLKLSECPNICESSSRHYLSLPLSGLFLVIREDTALEKTQIFYQELRCANDE